MQAQETSQAETRQEETVVLSAPEIPAWLEKDKNSLLVNWLYDIGVMSGIRFDIKVLPGVRSKVVYEHGEADAFFPVFVNFPEQETSRPSVFSESVQSLKWGVFSAPGSEPFQSLEDLKGKRIGLVHGYTYHPDIMNNQDMMKIWNPDEKKNLVLLMRGRLDAIIMFPDDLAWMRRELGFSEFVHSKNVDVGTAHIGFAFSDTEFGRSLQSRINASLEKMRQDGTLPLRLEIP